MLLRPGCLKFTEACPLTAAKVQSILLARRSCRGVGASRQDGYGPGRVWSHHTLTHNWKEACDFNHGDYNYRVAAEALQSNGSWGPPIYSPVKNAHCGPSA
jgi:hypothetical protein